MAHYEDATESKRLLMDAMSLFPMFFENDSMPQGEAKFAHAEDTRLGGNAIESNWTLAYEMPSNKATFGYVEAFAAGGNASESNGPSTDEAPHDKVKFDYVDDKVPSGIATESNRPSMCAMPHDGAAFDYVEHIVPGRITTKSNWPSTYAMPCDEVALDYVENTVTGGSAAESYRSSTDTVTHDEVVLGIGDEVRQLPMDVRLLKSATPGKIVALVRDVSVGGDINILVHKTPEQENTCLHLAAIYGDKEYAKQIISSKHLLPLIYSTNKKGETALMVAVMVGNTAFASYLLDAASEYQLRELGDENQDSESERETPFGKMILNIDKNEDNILHHALRNGHKSLAMRLLMIEPKLSKRVNKFGQSAMYMAARKGYADVVEKLLHFPFSEDKGPDGRTALHAAVKAGYRRIVRSLLSKRGKLAKAKNDYGNSPLHNAVRANRVDMVHILLEHDHTSAYVLDNVNGLPAFACAACYGHVAIAKEIIHHCPIDAAYIADKAGCNALHLAIDLDHTEFVKFILKTPELHGLINQFDNEGQTVLHRAAQRCNPDIIRALITNESLDRGAANPAGELPGDIIHTLKLRERARTIKWNEAKTLIFKDNPFENANVAWDRAEKELDKEAKKDIKSRTTTYTNNTTLVAILIATITFAAAFTMPGGYSSNPGSGEGLPVLARKLAFKVFLISDTLAMCSSLAVAFLCILTISEDNDYLEYYKKVTSRLMWFAYGATTLTFAMGLFTLVAPSSMWIATIILMLCVGLPFLTMLLGRWLVYKVYFRVGCAFRSDLLFKI